MEEKNDNLFNEMETFSAVEDVRFKNLGLYDHVWIKRNKLKNEYETVFSWDIEKLTGKNGNKNVLSNFIVRIRKRSELNIDNNDGMFNLNRYLINIEYKFNICCVKLSYFLYG